MCLADAGIEACDILSALDLLDSSFAVLQVAPASAVVHHGQVSIDLEALELQFL